MRAARYEQTGPAHQVLHVTEVPTPTTGPGEVRVRVHFSGINPSDVKSRSGLLGPPAFPSVIPHSDGAGVIDAVGEGVPAARVGERVWLWNAAWGRPHGTAAESVVLSAAQAVALPAAVEDLAVGACLGIPALTAYHALATDGGVRGQRVLVTGGAGAVGHDAVQMARLLGARQVLATVSGPEKAALAANLAADIRALRPDGLLVAYGSGAREIPVPFGPMLLKNLGLRFFIVYHLSAADRARAVADLTRWLETGALVHDVAVRLPLEQAAEGHVLVEEGRVRGNVVLTVP